MQRERTRNHHRDTETQRGTEKDNSNNSFLLFSVPLCVSVSLW